MTPEMRRILYEVSVLNDPKPDVVFERIAAAIGEYYAGAMAMINLSVEGCLHFRAMVNPHRVIRRLSTNSVHGTFCLLAIQTSGPILIQDASQRPDLAGHPAIRFKLTRYLGVPILDTNGVPVGTLCFLDGRSADHLGDADVQFLSLLAMRVSAEVERERTAIARLEEHRATAEHTRLLLERLQASAEEKRRFVSMVIHDLRHPLATMQTVLYLLRSEEDPTERALYLDSLENRARALAGLLDGLTQYHRIEAGQISSLLESVQIENLIQGCVAELAPDISERGLAYRCDVDPRLGAIRTDREKLTHILANLISNALKFTSRGTISVRAAALPGAWRMEVEDTGIGIKPDDKARIFEEFYRSQASNQLSRPGSGLGLAIVKRLCDAMGATVEVDSVYGRGTRIAITFPRPAEPAGPVSAKDEPEG